VNLGRLLADRQTLFAAPHAGSQLLAAGYALYGPATTIVLTTGNASAPSPFLLVLVLASYLGTFSIIVLAFLY
jgi:fructose-1,6-bisphosphatase